MRVFLHFVLIITLALAVAAQTSTPNVEGNWLGTLELGGAKLRLVLKIEKSANGYAAKFDSLDQGAANLPSRIATRRSQVIILSSCGPII